MHLCLIVWSMYIRNIFTSIGSASPLPNIQPTSPSTHPPSRPPKRIDMRGEPISKPETESLPQVPSNEDKLQPHNSFLSELADILDPQSRENSLTPNPIFQSPTFQDGTPKENNLSLVPEAGTLGLIPNAEQHNSVPQLPNLSLIHI